MSIQGREPGGCEWKLFHASISFDRAGPVGLHVASGTWLPARRTRLQPHVRCPDVWMFGG